LEGQETLALLATNGVLKCGRLKRYELGTLTKHDEEVELVVARIVIANQD
jgi:hypothetical protein